VMKPSPSVPLRDFAASLELIAEPVVRAALLEDIGRGGDLTSESIVAPERTARGAIVARKGGILAGLDIALRAFAILDAHVQVRTLLCDGDRIEAGAHAAMLDGPARAILTGERTALNLLSHLSGIATATLADSIHAAVSAARAHTGHMVKVEIEVDTLEQLREALREPIDAVLLDNMAPAQLSEAVRIVNGRVITEASGGVTTENVVEIARSGVDLISVGWLTHSAPALDFSLELGGE